MSWVCVCRRVIYVRTERTVGQGFECPVSAAGKEGEKTSQRSYSCSSSDTVVVKNECRYSSSISS